MTQFKTKPQVLQLFVVCIGDSLLCLYIPNVQNLNLDSPNKSTLYRRKRPYGFIHEKMTKNLKNNSQSTTHIDPKAGTGGKLRVTSDSND